MISLLVSQSIEKKNNFNIFSQTKEKNKKSKIIAIVTECNTKEVIIR